MKPNRTSFSFGNLAPYIVLILAPCLLLWRSIFLGLPFVPAALLTDIAPWKAAHTIVWDPLMWDGVAEFYPWRYFTSQVLHTGNLPFWNPHQFCGTPFVANSQSAIFYPFNLIFEIFPVAKAFGISVYVHLVMTGVFLYWFLRSKSVGLSRSSAIIGALTWQLSNWQASWLELPTFLCVSCWLPLILLCIDRALAKLSAGRLGALGGVLGLVLLAGHLQIALYSILLAVGYAVFQVVRLKRSGAGVRTADLVTSVLFVGLIMFAIGAPQLLPSVELSRYSHRAASSHSLAAYAGYNKLAVAAYQILSLVAPGFFGSPSDGNYWGATNYAENACYIGIFGLLLAAVAVGFMVSRREWTGGSRASAIFFSSAAFVSLLMAFGTPLNALPFYLIPGFSQTGSPGRILVLWSLCGSVLAGLGAQVLLDGIAAKRADWMKPAGIAIGGSLGVIAAVGFIGLFILRSGGIVGTALAEYGGQFRITLGFLLCFGALVWFVQKGTLSKALFQFLLATFVVIDLTVATTGLNTQLAPQVYPATALTDYLAANVGDARIMPINTHWSLDPNHPPQAILPPNSATVYGLDDIAGYDSLFTSQYIQFIASLNGGAPTPTENGNMVFPNGYLSPLIREAGVKYLVTDTPIDATEELQLEKTIDGHYVYANRVTMPMYWDPSGNVLSVDKISPTHTRLKMVEGLGGNRLMIAEQWFPGWHATLDGQSIPIAPEPDIFKTIIWNTASKNAGRTITVDLRFEPMSIKIGLYLALFAIAVLAGILTESIVSGKQKKTSLSASSAS